MQADDMGTPKDLLEMIKKEFPINLDAAANYDNRVCEAYFNKKDDALTRPWDVFQETVVFVHPPGGKNIRKWAHKCLVESSRCKIVVALLPASVETDWFKHFVFGKSEVRFINGRIKFHDGKHHAKRGSMIVIWGKDVKPCFKIMLNPHGINS